MANTAANTTSIVRITATFVVLMWACKWLASTSFCDSPKVWNFPFARTNHLFAAPMAGAPPDNIGAKRLAEGSVSASGAGSASMGAKEITKIHENIIKGNLDNILDKIKLIVLKGEVTIVLSSEANKNKDQNIDINKEILDLSKKMKTADLAKYLSKKFKFSKKEIYQKILIFNKK